SNSLTSSRCPPFVISNISRGFTSHHTGTVPLCSTTGSTSSILRTSTGALLRHDSEADGSVGARRPRPEGPMAAGESVQITLEDDPTPLVRILGATLRR